jgi:hypothetical protein
MKRYILFLIDHYNYYSITFRSYTIMHLALFFNFSFQALLKPSANRFFVLLFSSLAELIKKLIIQ